MAFFETRFCHCGNSYMANTANPESPRICGACQNKAEENKRQEFFDKLKALPLEERVDKLVEMFYSLLNRKSAYAPPPQY